jgi:thiosulfate:glutathione sulfurtransferase
MLQWISRMFAKSRPTVDYAAVAAALRSGSPVVIDVRGAEEIKRDGALPGAVNIPLGDLRQALDASDWKSRYGVQRPPQDQPVIFSCRSGVRAASAADLAASSAFPNAAVYSGSYLDWASHRTSGN